MRKIITTLIILIICVMPVSVLANEKENEINIGAEYGTIYGSERNPNEGDTSKWLTIKSGDSGVRVVSKDGKEIVAIDNYGGIYLNGDVYMANKKINPNESYKANGFMYSLIIVSLCSNLYLLINRHKNK